ncbi:DUF484 family protein [Caldovatus aquaticus]|uniref:DUF484 family protein n=1 Tax=Caldovatus aquaticus TaxID=2865671 RepID=A0ABS7F8K4_9PROT|nr:DUF484 family protein [Caldovatus aquaticus]
MTAHGSTSTAAASAATAAPASATARAGEERGPADPEAEAVAAFLRAHPEFLAERPELYRVLLPPRRVHGEVFADHMAAMLAAERNRLRAIEAEMDALLADGRAGAGLAVRVRLAVLALMRATDVVETVTQELPALLGVETCSLAAEPAPAQPYRRHAAPGWTRGVLPLPQGTVARLLGPGRDAVVRSQPTDREMLHAEAAPLVARDALARVPLFGAGPMLLAIGAREPAALPARQAAATIAFLGRAVGAALARG